jgi:DNA polymerase-3 subunit alpha
VAKNFYHLHNHTDASIQDGLFGVKKWVDALKTKGFGAHAVCDHGIMTNLMPFYKAARAEKITPILGVEFYFVDEPTLKVAENRKSSHLILLAKNYEGFQNLCRLSKLSFTEGYYYKNRIGLEWLSKHREGLVCLTACQGGVLSQEVWNESKARETIGLEARFRQFQALFGDDFYVEFQGHVTMHFDEDSGETFNGQELINKAFYERLRGLSGFQQIVTNDCHYILPEHAAIQKLIKDTAWKTSKATDVSGDSATVNKDHFTDSLWLKNAVQVYEAFRTHHEYLPKQFVADGMKNTVAIFEKCKDLVLPEGRRYLPKYRTETNSKKLFTDLTKAKLIEFLGSGDLHGTKREYIDRFKKEFAVISKYNLEDYFLIVWDLVRFANERGIYSGIGRGSAAGCFISYLLDIVKIDPIEHKLIFERFLNENRCESGELPDIDLDFESDHRREIKDYIFRTYGGDKVCEIGTYNRMKLKTSLIDFGKALGVGTQAELLKITTNLDLDKEDVEDFDAAAEHDPRLLELFEKNPQYSFSVREIIGQIKSQGIHPAGVIICSEPIANITPIKTQKRMIKAEDRDEDGAKDTRVVTTQAEDKSVIAQGLMKVDVLGLKEYDVIRYVIENADTGLTQENYVREIMRRERVSPDLKVWKMFQQGNSDGVFQFASSGMKELLRMIKPTHINDLIAANALYRPGCLENGWHILYADRKHGREPVEYVHPDVEAALGHTFGVIVFQEQFMEVIHKLGGISLVDSDTIRSALGKKDKAKLEKFRERFVEGATLRIGEDKARELWEQIEKASGYSFNLSHSAAYSVLAYISQYLKTYYPAHFWAGQLDWAVRKNKLEDMLENRRAASDMGVDFVLPDINLSKMNFFVHEKSKVVWSLCSVQGVGSSAAEEIVAKQPFVDFDDFYERVNKSKVRYNNIEGLILAGAFDAMGDRRDFLSILVDKHNERAKSKTSKKKKRSYSEQEMIFAFYNTMGFF